LTAHTRSISIAASPRAVFELVTDPAALPRWAPGNQGVFTRVLPNGAGSEYQFTMLFPAELGAEAIGEQLKTVEAELEAVRALCEEQH
jgi:uncharacterized protein YndB with AHSA1/START domain